MSGYIFNGVIVFLHRQCFVTLGLQNLTYSYLTLIVLGDVTPLGHFSWNVDVKCKHGLADRVCTTDRKAVEGRNSQDWATNLQMLSLFACLDCANSATLKSHRAIFSWKRGRLVITDSLWWTPPRQALDVRADFFFFFYYYCCLWHCQMDWFKGSWRDPHCSVCPEVHLP